MRVIICGAGQVGYGIAERLAAEKNDVSIIDIQPPIHEPSNSRFSPLVGGLTRVSSGWIVEQW